MRNATHGPATVIRIGFCDAGAADAGFIHSDGENLALTLMTSDLMECER
jgi:hypothetical protein